MSKIDYSNINDRINFLYKTVYERQKKACKDTIKPIIKANIDQLTLKMPATFNTELVFDAKIKYLGEENNSYKFIRKAEDTKDSLISVRKYIDNRMVNDIENCPEMNNALFHYLFSEIALNKNYHNIMLPIMMFDTTISQIENENMQEILKDKVDEKTKLNVMIYENYRKTVSLEDFLKKKQMKLNDWKVLFFQVLFVLAKLNENYDFFRHNKLDLNSVRICEIEQTQNEYETKNITFVLPKVDFEIKITDFYESVIKNYTNNTTKKTAENQYYDIHYFMSSILLFINKEKIKIDGDVEVFLNRVIYDKFKPEKGKPFVGLDEDMYEKTSSGNVSALGILTKNIFFSEFIMNSEASSIQNEHIKLAELQEKDSDIKYGGSTSNTDVDETSPIDDGGPKNLARNINKNKNKNKKSKQYNKESMNQKKKFAQKYKKDFEKRGGSESEKDTESEKAYDDSDNDSDNESDNKESESLSLSDRSTSHGGSDKYSYKMKSRKNGQKKPSKTVETATSSSYNNYSNSNSTSESESATAKRNSYRQNSQQNNQQNSQQNSQQNNEIYLNAVPSGGFQNPIGMVGQQYGNMMQQPMEQQPFYPGMQSSVGQPFAEHMMQQQIGQQSQFNPGMQSLMGQQHFNPMEQMQPQNMMLQPQFVHPMLQQNQFGMMGGGKRNQKYLLVDKNGNKNTDKNFFFSKIETQ